VVHPNLIHFMSLVVGLERVILRENLFMDWNNGLNYLRQLVSGFERENIYKRENKMIGCFNWMVDFVFGKQLLLGCFQVFSKQTLSL